MFSYADILGKFSDSVNTENVNLDIIRGILDRFNRKYKTSLLPYIKEITRVGFAIDEGFYFTSDNRHALKKVLMGTNKFVDDSASFVGRICMKATHGIGYRETGSKMTDKSLHFALAHDLCSVHLDETLFTITGPDGNTYYSLDAAQHGVNDLAWRDKIVRPISNWNKPIGSILGRVRPVVPNTSDGLFTYGADFNISKSKNVSLNFQYRRDFNYNNFYKLKKDSVEGFLGSLKGFDGGNAKYMVNLELRHDWLK